MIKKLISSNIDKCLWKRPSVRILPFEKGLIPHWVYIQVISFLQICTFSLYTVVIHSTEGTAHMKNLSDIS